MGSHHPMTYTAQPMAHHGFKPLSARRAAAAAVLMLTATAMQAWRHRREVPRSDASEQRRMERVRSITPPSKAPSGSL
ncbi:MAG: hypothetical protein CM15mP18_3240 [Methanobacteriota archaeon]|nr:MAG: hypothetical protein CM15mP18_3240 [Euryarchaeota archaeon]